MSTIFIVNMVLEKGRLDSFLLLDLGPPCCLGQLLDLWLTNSEILSELSFFIYLFFLDLVSHSILPSCSECRGRKRACVTYCITYILSCITKHSPHYKILMVGRILGGIATSLLFSAFESWLVAEHNKVRGCCVTFHYFSYRLLTYLLSDMLIHLETMLKMWYKKVLSDHWKHFLIPHFQHSVPLPFFVSSYSYFMNSIF